MKDFGDFQVSSWMSNGMLVEIENVVQERLKIASTKLSKFLTSSIVAVATFCTIALPLGGAVSTVGGAPNVVQYESPQYLARASDREIQRAQNGLSQLRARLSARDFSAYDNDLLALALQARTVSESRMEESAESWAQTLVKSQYA